jgi:hypothetical protein
MWGYKIFFSSDTQRTNFIPFIAQINEIRQFNLKLYFLFFTMQLL